MNRFLSVICLITFIFLAPVGDCRAQTVICPCVADTMVASEYPYTNYGYVNYWGAGTYAEYDCTMRSFVRFNLSAIPVNATVIEVWFYGWVSLTENNRDYDYYFYVVTEDWQEMIVTWDNQPALDYSAPLVTIPAVSSDEFWYQVKFGAAALQIVQGWVETPGSNHGVGFLRESEAEMGIDQLFFDSREAPHPSHLLLIWQSPETVQPESLGKIKAMF